MNIRICSLLLMIMFLRPHMILGANKKNIKLANQKVIELKGKLKDATDKIELLNSYLLDLDSIKNKIYNEYIYKYIVNYDEEFNSTAYGTLLLHTLVYWYENDDYSIEKSIDSIKKLEKFIKKDKFIKIDKKEGIIEYSFTAEQVSKDQIIETSNFDRDLYERKLEFLLEDLKSRNSIFEISYENLKLTSQLVDQFQTELYHCHIMLPIQLTFGFGAAGAGRVICLDALGGEYKWPVASQGEWFKGLGVSLNAGKTLPFLMTKSSSSEEKIKSNIDFCTSIFLGDIEDNKKGKYINTHFSLGLGGGSDVQYSIKLQSKKRLSNVILSELKYHKFLNGKITEEEVTHWIKLRNFIHDSYLNERIKNQLKSLNLKKVNYDERIKGLQNRINKSK